MKDQNPKQRLSAAYGDSKENPRRQKSRAALYQPNPEYERLIALKDSDPQTFSRITNPTLRTALGFYESAKQAHQAEQHKKG